MGSGSSRSGDSLTVGKSPEEAEGILRRRLAKCREALVASEGGDMKKAARAQEKALGVINLCAAWDGTPGSRGSLPPALLLESAVRAWWVLENHCEGQDSFVLTSLLPKLLALVEKVHGPQSLQVAEVLHSMAHRANDQDDYHGGVKWGTRASTLLLTLRGESFYLPHALRKGEYFSTWDNASHLHLCEESHIDCLGVLAEAHAKIEGQTSLAHAAAGRMLGLLEGLYGRGHLNTLPGLTSMMWATYSGGKDVAGALVWGNRAIGLIMEATGGKPTEELAGAYETVAYLLVNEGPSHNVGAAQKIADKALAIRRSGGLDETPNVELQQELREWREGHERGEYDSWGRALAVAAGVVGAMAVIEGVEEMLEGGEEGEEDGEGEGLFGTLSAAYDAVSGEEEGLAEKASGIISGENLGKVVDFFSAFF